MLTDTVTWMGGLHEGMKAFNGDFGKAKQNADRRVIRTQGTAMFKDRIAAERGTISKNIRNTEMVRMWTLFMNYFATKMNGMYEVTSKRNFKNPIEVMTYPVDIALLYFAEALVITFVRSFFADDKDEDDPTKRFALAVLWEATRSFTSGIPGVRDVTGAIEGFNAGGSIGSFLFKLGQALAQVKQGEVDKAAVRAMTNVLGIAFKIPTSQPFRTIDTAISYEDTKWDDQDWWKYISGSGPR